MIKYNRVCLMIDEIVFTQAQLDKAIDKGCYSIVLCDNSFNIPPIGNKVYTALGKVTAKVMFSEAFANEQGIVFSGFKPFFVVSSLICEKQSDSYSSGLKKTSSYIFSGSSSAQSGSVFVGGYGIDLI